MSFPLLQHIELLPQIEYSFLRCIFPLLRAITTEPGSPHVDGCYPELDLQAQETLTPPYQVSGSSRSWQGSGVVEKVFRFDD